MTIKHTPTAEIALYDPKIGVIRAFLELTDDLAKWLDARIESGWRILRVSRFTTYQVKER